MVKVWPQLKSTVLSFEDTVKLGGKDLKLNGAGMWVKAAFFKLYVAALYLPEKEHHGRYFGFECTEASAVGNDARDQF